MLAKSSRITESGGEAPSGAVKVWDPFIRWFHWLLVILFAAAWYSGGIWDNPHLVTGYGVTIGSIGLRVLTCFGSSLARSCADLRISQRHHLVLTISTGWGLLSCAPGISAPRLSSPRSACRSSLGGCGSQ